MRDATPSYGTLGPRDHLPAPAVRSTRSRAALAGFVAVALGATLTVVAAVVVASPHVSAVWSQLQRVDAAASCAVMGEGKCKTATRCNWDHTALTCGDATADTTVESGDDGVDDPRAPVTTPAPSVTPSPSANTSKPTLAPTHSDRTPRPTPRPISPPTPAPTPEPFAYSLVKRTHTTTDASGDARFLHEFLGLRVTFNETYTDADGTCATRITLDTLPNFQIHLFESRVTPDGPRGVAAWVEYWRELHAGFETAPVAWDAFMANSMTFYTPDLTPFVRKLRARGVPVLAATYTDASGATVYSASVVLPGTGSLVEVVAEHIDASEVSPFDGATWPSTACGDANKLLQPVSSLRELWTWSSGNMHACVNDATSPACGPPRGGGYAEW